MKNRIVKKILRIILLTIVGAAVIGTFYFLWKKAQPVITVYEVVTPKRDTVETKTVATGSVEPRYEVEIKPQISGIISELRKEAGQMVFRCLLFLWLFQYAQVLREFRTDVQKRIHLRNQCFPKLFG